MFPFLLIIREFFMDIESMAVTAIKNLIAWNNYLTSFINDKDKEPSWDGNIYVYSTPTNTHNKKDLVGRVPVQVKGHISCSDFPDEVSYSVDTSDLRNYLHDGGIIYFVVYLNTNNHAECIYYKVLLPFELKNLLNDSINLKSKTIYLRRLPTNQTDLSLVFFDFVRDRKKQLSFASSNIKSGLDIFSNGKLPNISMSFSSLGTNIESITDANFISSILNRGAYIYADLDFGIEIPIHYVDKFDSITEECFEPVTIGNKIYYSSYSLTHTHNGSTFLSLGKCSTFKLGKDGEKSSFSFKAKGTLNERIKDYTFLSAFLSSKSFKIGNLLYSIDLKDFSQFSEFQATYNALLKSKSILDYFNVQQDLDLDHATESDLRNLSRLVVAIDSGKSVYLQDTGSAFLRYHIANLVLLICAVKQPDESTFHIFNFFSAPVEPVIVDEHRNEYKCPAFLLIKHDDILECCNINWDSIIDQTRSYNHSPAILERIVWFALETLLAFDASPQQKKLLDYAEQLIEIVKSTHKYPDDTVLTLNILQIQKRKRKLLSKEKFDLMDIIRNHPNNFEICAGAYLLLDEPLEAKLCLSKLSAEQQRFFTRYPIYHFMISPK